MYVDALFCYLRLKILHNYSRYLILVFCLKFIMFGIVFTKG